MTKVEHETPDIYDLTYKTPDIYDLTYKRERCLCICYTLDCSKYWQIIKPAYLGKCHHLCKNWSNSCRNTMNVRKRNPFNLLYQKHENTMTFFIVNQ